MAGHAHSGLIDLLSLALVSQVPLDMVLLGEKRIMRMRVNLSKRSFVVVPRRNKRARYPPPSHFSLRGALSSYQVSVAGSFTDSQGPADVDHIWSVPFPHIHAQTL